MSNGETQCRSLAIGWAWLGALLIAVGSAGCLAPIGADRTSSRVAYRDFTETALTGGVSDSTRAVLRRYDLLDKYESDPAATLQLLHRQACVDDRRDPLYALAELSYQHADRLWRSVRPWEPAGAPDYFLAASIYSYLYLFGDGDEPPPGSFDRRFRTACDLYNSAVVFAFMSPQRTNGMLEFASGVRPALAATVGVEFREELFRWRQTEIDGFLPADHFVLRGLSVRDRRSGIGAPVIVLGRMNDPKELPRRAAATVFLRVTGDLQDWSDGKLRTAVEIYASSDARFVDVNGRAVPLEADLSASLAYALNDSMLWDLGLEQFFSSEEKIRSDIYPTQPFQPGRIPVIFVHGTASSPVWWAEMWNTLRADPVLGQNFQFWNFVYNTGNPIPQSAARLRAAIDAKVARYDPDGSDKAIQQMVVIGHSQGGLLAKLTACDTGDLLWRQVSDQPPHEYQVSPELGNTLSNLFFFKPLPSVKRVIFIATPHRGSFRATGLVLRILRYFIQLPTETIRLTQKLTGLLEPDEELSRRERQLIPTSVDGMCPTNQYLLTLADVPVSPQVAAHSIIAIRTAAEPPLGDDGVVEYSSAHVDYVRSERIIRSGHSCQDKPMTIEEVRRILLEHLDAYSVKPPGPDRDRSVIKSP